MVPTLPMYLCTYLLSYQTTYLLTQLFWQNTQVYTTFGPLFYVGTDLRYRGLLAEIENVGAAGHTYLGTPPCLLSTESDIIVTGARSRGSWHETRYRNHRVPRRYEKANHKPKGICYGDNAIQVN